MGQVVPAVIPTSRRHLDRTLDFFASFSDEVQVDIVDGVFAPRASWPYAVLNSSTSLTNILSDVRFEQVSVELDLMIDAPEETIDTWLHTRVTRIIVHVESTERLPDIIDHAGRHGYMFGLAFNNETPLTLLNEIDMSCVDFIQLMGIAEIGKQGQPFDDRVLSRIQEVKRMFPDLLVSIDGSVNQKTLPRLRDAGADRFISGSAILRAENPENMYCGLSALANYSK